MVAVPYLTTSTIQTTRGGDLRLQKNSYTRYDLRKFFLLTELSIHVCGTVCLMILRMQTLLKTRLGKFWSNQEIIYDYHAEIQGTGSRSEIY